MKRLLIPAGFFILGLALIWRPAMTVKGQEASTTTRQGPTTGSSPLILSDEEWARRLTRDQFLVLRRKATEPAFSGRFVRHHAKGTYHCAGCESPLFSSRTKFNSGTGWPSFNAPIAPGRVYTELDHSLFETRMEVLCSGCGGHLGHVFGDGPRPTGQRFCINSAALKFLPEAKATSEAKTTTPTKAKGSVSKDEGPARDAEAKQPDNSLD